MGVATKKWAKGLAVLTFLDKTNQQQLDKQSMFRRSTIWQSWRLLCN